MAMQLIDVRRSRGELSPARMARSRVRSTSTGRRELTSVTKRTPAAPRACAANAFFSGFEYYDVTTPSNLLVLSLSPGS